MNLKELAALGFVVSQEQFEAFGEDKIRRIEAWILNDSSPLPRFLIPFFVEGKNSLTNYTDDQKWEDGQLAIEIADTLTLLGLTVTDGKTALDRIAAFTPEEVAHASDWTIDVWQESAEAAAENLKPLVVPMPECVAGLRLVPTDEPAETPLDSNLPAETAAAATEPTPTPPTPPTPPARTGGAETREQAIARLQAGLHEIRGRYIERREDYESKAEAAKSAKKAMESAQDELNDLVGELDEAINGKEFQPRLPLDYSGGDTTATTVTFTSSVPKMDVTHSTVAATDPAKSASIEQLTAHGVSEKQVEKLQAADIDTIAELESRIRDVVGWFSKIKGIGESAADKISDALITWRTANGYGEASGSN